MTLSRMLLQSTLLLAAAGNFPALAQLSPQEIASISAALPRSATVRPRQPRLLLVFNRSEGYKHSAIPRAAAALEMMGKTTGAFETVQSEDPAALRADNLKRFDAVCMNNTTQLKFEDPEVRTSLLEFVATGKGIIGIHAATDNFPTWPEGQELFGGVFDSHPWTAEGTWAVTITDPDHPLTAAFRKKDFLINDEIYRIRQVGLRKNSRVLLALDMKNERNRRAPGVRSSDRDLPISWVRTVGKGRLFYSSLGHNDNMYANPAILRHYLDGIQFALGDLPATTEPVPFDPMSAFDQTRLNEILRQVSQYRYGDSRAALAALDAFVRNVDDLPEARARIEKQFGDFLKGDATPAGKEFVLSKLAHAGSDSSVPLLSGMLSDTATSGPALLALGSIPGAAADAALLNALRQTGGPAKIGIISVLGDRRAEGAVADLETLAADADARIASASVSALGRIGSVASLESLERLNVSPREQADVLDAMLAAADRLRVAGQRDRALGVYRRLHSAVTPEPARSAALRGVVLTDPANAAGALAEALRSKDPVYQSAAAMLVGGISDTAAFRSIARWLPDLPPAVQVELLAAFSRRSDPEVQKTVLAALESERSEVRIAALRSAGSTGDAGAVRALVRTAAGAAGAEQKEARMSLANLHAPGVDDSLIALLPGTGSRRKVEIIRALGERRASAAVPHLLQSARDPSPAIREESAKTLRSLAGPDQVPAMVDMLVASREDAERRQFESAVASAARRNPDRGSQDSAVLAAYSRTKDRRARASLIAVCGSIGAPASLPVLRGALGDRDREIRMAALRALSAWPSPEPFPDLWAVAGGKGETAERTLALRGSVRLLGLDSSRAPAGRMNLFREAMTIAPNDAERKTLLSAVGESRSVAGLPMAAGYFSDKNLRPEAEAAVLNIVEALGDTAGREAVPQLRQIQASSGSESNARKAGEIIGKIELYDDYITSWVYAGPYHREWVRLLDEPFGPELPDVPSVRWIPFSSMTNPLMPWVQEIEKNVSGEDNAVYLRTNVWSPAAQRARCELGSDAGIKVWLNGRLVHAANVVRRVVPGDDRVPVQLQNGWNTLMLKLEQGDGPWRACARIRSSDGGKLEGIRVSATQQ